MHTCTPRFWSHTPRLNHHVGPPSSPRVPRDNFTLHEARCQRRCASESSRTAAEAGNSFDLAEEMRAQLVHDDAAAAAAAAAALYQGDTDEEEGWNLVTSDKATPGTSPCSLHRPSSGPRCKFPNQNAVVHLSRAPHPFPRAAARTRAILYLAPVAALHYDPLCRSNPLASTSRVSVMHP